MAKTPHTKERRLGALPSKNQATGIMKIGRVDNPACTKTVAGLSNLRQIGLGFTQYALENRGMFPYEIGTAGALDRRTWHVAIAPYLAGFSLDDLNASIGERPVGVYACPNSKNLTRSGNYADYGMNIYINGHEDEQGGFQ
ncbi:MAG: hypothetical protein JJU29_00315 [Verrucomicrobia bacterium]|nr:hypothetical protein [Verrucomicrobiota bacterium]MCH8517991.1 hypothetical protein [Cyclobacteriaceae bacterium]